jgi:hypothetical protein
MNPVNQTMQRKASMPSGKTTIIKVALSLAFFAATLLALPAPSIAAPKAKAAAKKKKPAPKKKGLTFKKDWRRVAHPLIVASYDGDVTKVVSALRKKPNINITLKGQFRDAERMRGIIGGTALLFASWQGQSRVVPLLLKAKADVNARDIYKRTPLHWASANGHYRVCEMLIKAGAQINAKDKGGKTPAFLTVDDRTLAVIKKAGGKEE